MHCAACAQSIEKALKREPGVISTSVNFATEKAMVEYNIHETSLQRIGEIIKESGYEAVGTQSENQGTKEINLK
ncbi:MAG: heavy-metal-associated domain-containing protein, partial [Candidatus Bathyarchaeota archaeon]